MRGASDSLANRSKYANTITTDFPASTAGRKKGAHVVAGRRKCALQHNGSERASRQNARTVITSGEERARWDEQPSEPHPSEQGAC